MADTTQRAPLSDGMGMTRLGRFTMLVAAMALSSGCGAAVRPYAHDPLIRDGAAVRGDPTRSHERELFAGPGPLPPRPPYPNSLATAGEDGAVPSGQISFIFQSTP